MIERKYGYLRPLHGAESVQGVPEASKALEENGFALLPQVFAAAEIEELARDIDRVFDELPPDPRPSSEKSPEDDVYRYEMLNRSAACQRAIGHARILEAIEPLLGGDCHVIANTAWRNPAGESRSHGGQMWHIDAGPHVPRPAGTRWPEDIPYPVFAIGAHMLLVDSRIEDGPTGVIPGSHRSGQHPPFDALMDPKLSYEGHGCTPLLGSAGDVALFVSDVWHRRMPTLPGEHGRYFLQAHYARRDIAQRLRPTADINQLSEQAKARAQTERDRSLVGLHDPMFYDG